MSDELLLGQLPTWEDIEREALTCPVLHQMMTRIRMGHVSREDALLATVRWLSRDRKRMMDREVERLQREPFRSFSQ